MSNKELLAEYYENIPGFKNMMEKDIQFYLDSGLSEDKAIKMLLSICSKLRYDIVEVV